MCNFKSAIVVKTAGNGFDLLYNQFTESHEDLVRLFKLNDTPTAQGEPRFARVEYRPDDVVDLGDIKKYRLIIDELRTPEWFSESMQDKVTARLRLIVKDMIITGDADLICGGAFILADGARVSAVKNCLIHVMLGSSNVGVMLGSSNVGVMRDSSNVGEMLGSSKVGEMLGSSKVGVMLDSSKVGEMWDSSKVGVMLDSSKVGVMWDSSKVGEMRDSSKVGVMWDSSNAPKKPTTDNR